MGDTMLVCLGISARHPVNSFWAVTFAHMFRVFKYPTILIYDNMFAIDLSRNKIVEVALSTECDKLIMVDTDIIPYKCEKGQCSVFYDALNYIVDNYADKKVIGVYHQSKKFEPNVYLIDAYRETDEGIPEMALSPLAVECGTGTYKVHVMGMGITMIDRKVLESVEFPWFRFETKRMRDGKIFSMGEDIYFFLKLYKKGIDVFVTTDVCALHIGEFCLDVGNKVRQIGTSWTTQQPHT